MSRLSCTLLILAWLVLFTAPAAILWWAMGPGWEIVAAETGWSAWVSVPVTIVGALFVAGAWIVVVWPRLFGYRRPDHPSHGPAPVQARRVEPPAPEPPANAASTANSSKSSEDEDDVGLKIPLDEVRRVYEEAVALATSGDHAGACRRVTSLSGQSPGGLTNPHVGCYWGALEDSADAARDEARDAARFVYELCIAEATREQHFATASGEARSAQVTIDRLRGKQR